MTRESWREQAASVGLIDLVKHPFLLARRRNHGLGQPEGRHYPLPLVHSHVDHYLKKNKVSTNYQKSDTNEQQHYNNICTNLVAFGLRTRGWRFIFLHRLNHRDTVLHKDHHRPFLNQETDVEHVLDWRREGVRVENKPEINRTLNSRSCLVNNIFLSTKTMSISSSPQKN